MTQAQLDFAATKTLSLCDRLAAYFKDRPGQWVNARDLFSVAGSFAWRSRVAECRFPPFSMTIENRVSRRKNANGEKYTVSEYRYIPSGGVSVGPVA